MSSAFAFDFTDREQVGAAILTCEQIKESAWTEIMDGATDPALVARLRMAVRDAGFLSDFLSAGLVGEGMANG